MKLLQQVRDHLSSSPEVITQKFEHEYEAEKFCNCFAGVIGVTHHATSCNIWKHKL